MPSSLWLRTLRLFLVAYLTLCGYGWFLSERQIFLPPPSGYGPGLLQLPVLKLASAKDVAIAAVHLPNPQAQFTVLYSHGNGEDLAGNWAFLQQLQRAGFAVLAYDYRGYGLSQGRPSEQGSYADIEAAYRYAVDTLKVPPSQILVHGRSVGGGPSTFLASRYPVGGLILESTFVDTFRVVTRIPLVPFSKFPSLSRIPQVRCPVLVIHGTQDQTIPLWHGQTLWQAVQTPKQAFWVEGADHNDLVDVAGDRYFQTLKAFAQTLN